MANSGNNDAQPRNEGGFPYFDEPISAYPWYARFFRVLCINVAGLWARLYWRVSFSGPSPFKGERPSGGVGRVLIGNHSSMLDPVAVIYDAQRGGYHVRPLFKDEFLKNAFITACFKSWGGIGLHRGQADMKALKRAVKALKRGEDILIFPEGTRVWDPEARPEVFGGYAFIAQMAGADVVPFAIDGAERICPNKKGFPKPTKVNVLYGEPITWESLPGDDKRAKMAALETCAMETVYTMRAELRREANLVK